MPDLGVAEAGDVGVDGIVEAECALGVELREDEGREVLGVCMCACMNDSD
jgi:hypothetical protein